MQYSLAYAYYDEEGAMMYSGSKKHNISFNMNHEVNKWLSVNARISYDQMRVEGMGTSEGGDRFNKMQHILQYRPTIGINGVDTDLLGDEDPCLQMIAVMLCKIRFCQLPKKLKTESGVLSKQMQVLLLNY